MRCCWRRNAPCLGFLIRGSCRWCQRLLQCTNQPQGNGVKGIKREIIRIFISILISRVIDIDIFVIWMADVIDRLKTYSFKKSPRRTWISWENVALNMCLTFVNVRNISTFNNSVNRIFEIWIEFHSRLIDELWDSSWIWRMSSWVRVRNST